MDYDVSIEILNELKTIRKEKELQNELIRELIGSVNNVYGAIP